MLCFDIKYVSHDSTIPLDKKKSNYSGVKFETFLHNMSSVCEQVDWSKLHVLQHLFQTRFVPCCQMPLLHLPATRWQHTAIVNTCCLKGYVTVYLAGGMF